MSDLDMEAMFEASENGGRSEPRQETYTKRDRDLLVSTFFNLTVSAEKFSDKFLSLNCTQNCIIKGGANVAQQQCDQTFCKKMRPIVLKYCPKWSLNK
jgi:hypothetical protein